MLVVVAGRADRTASALAARWAAHDAAVLTSADLSTAGWQYQPGKVGTAVIGGRIVAVDAIRGVLTRLPYVPEQELGQIAAADRAYVAQEMTAFLAAWLAGLTCPVLNRPTPTCLAGPNWRPEQWVSTAAQLGLPVRPICRQSRLAADVAPAASTWQASTVTVVGDRCFGPVDETLAGRARCLAEAAGVGLLAVHFSGPTAGADCLGADLWPDVSSPEVADAIAAYLSGAGAC